jgi:hypothetical protein
MCPANVTGYLEKFYFHDPQSTPDHKWSARSDDYIRTAASRVSQVTMLAQVIRRVDLQGRHESQREILRQRVHAAIQEALPTHILPVAEIPSALKLLRKIAPTQLQLERLAAVGAASTKAAPHPQEPTSKLKLGTAKEKAQFLRKETHQAESVAHSAAAAGNQDESKLPIEAAKGKIPLTPKGKEAPKPDEPNADALLPKLPSNHAKLAAHAAKVVESSNPNIGDKPPQTASDFITSHTFDADTDPEVQWQLSGHDISERRGSDEQSSSSAGVGNAKEALQVASAGKLTPGHHSSSHISDINTSAKNAKLAGRVAPSDPGLLKE